MPASRAWGRRPRRRRPEAPLGVRRRGAWRSQWPRPGRAGARGVRSGAVRACASHLGGSLLAGPGHAGRGSGRSRVASSRGPRAWPTGWRWCGELAPIPPVPGLDRPPFRGFPVSYLHSAFHSHLQVVGTGGVGGDAKSNDHLVPIL